jgi:F-type H+-transporting ATPase subunit b
MGMFYWLATAAAEGVSEAAETHGFGLNFDILETNLINLSIVIGVVVYFGRGFLGGILSERKSAIATQINESESSKQKALQAQTEQEKKLAQAEAEAQQILANAEQGSKKVKEDILAQAILEIQRMEEGATADQTSSQERAIAELRQRVVELSLKKVEEELDAQLRNNPAAQQKLIDRSIALLGG